MSRELDFRVAEAQGAVACMTTPYYSTDIAAAWTLVEQMPFFKLTVAAGVWQCQSVHCGAWGDHVMESERDGMLVYRCGCRLGEGDTAPEAICCAFLAAKGVDDASD